MPRVRDLLVRKSARGVPTTIVSVGPDATVLEAARLMTERGIGGLLVLEGQGDAAALAGIFTERDILRRVVTEARDPSTTRVRDVMTSPVLVVTPDTYVKECRALFTERRIRHLPIVGPNGLCGVVTSGDLLAFEADEQRTTIEHLESYVYHNR
jgi:CBS domain-containing protein